MRYRNLRYSIPKCTKNQIILNVVRIPIYHKMPIGSLWVEWLRGFMNASPGANILEWLEKLSQASNILLETYCASVDS